MFVVLLSFLVSLGLSSLPPDWGPYKDSLVLKSIYIGDLKAGIDQEAFLMYPKVAENGEVFPFLGFGHGMTAGGDEAYWAYSDLWHQMASFGYVIAGPKSCRVEYCQEFWQDVITTMKACMNSSASTELDPILGNTNFSKTGVYGHSMGGGASTQVCSQTDLNLVGCGLLHPAIWADDDKRNEAKEIKFPTLWFTGSDDDLVPAPTVWKYYNEDPILPKACGELKGKNHFYPTGTSTNTEANYLAQFFECYIKGNQTGCNYIFSSTNGLCQGGNDYTKCEQNSTNIKYF